MSRSSTAVFALLVLAGSAGATDRAQLGNVTTQWQNAYGVIIYTVLADVKNVSATPLQFVKVNVTLLDKNGAPVAERDGYNMGAEALADDTVAGTVDDKLKRIAPIPAGGIDHFRLSLDKSDIGKPFRTARVTIVEVR